MPSYRTRKDGTVVIRWSERDPVTGRRRQPEQPGFRTKREAFNWWVRHVAPELERRDGRGLPQITLADWASSWLRSVRHTIAPNTYTTYEASIRIHIVPRLGDIQLAKLSAERIRIWHGELLDAGLSPRTVHSHHGTLNRMLKQALKDEVIDRNPAADNWPAVPEHGPRDFLDEDQRRRFLALLAPDDQLHVIWRTALYTGLRISELLGLRWVNVDRARGRLSVTEQLVMYRDGSWELRAPKTRRSIRTISLPAPCIADLNAHYRRQAGTRLALGELWQDHGLVFTRGHGQPMYRQYVTDRLQRFCELHGLPRISMHTLRRTHATWLGSLGEHPSVIQHRLGHASSRITLELYQQVSATMDQQAARLIEADLQDRADVASEHDVGV